MNPPDEKPWEVTRSETGPDLILFKTRYDWMWNPRTTHELKALVLESPDWVNIVALTPEEEIIVVHQYRFGVQKTTTEIPAGIVEPGEPHKQAAVRELQEETGFTTEKWEYLGKAEANPAFLNNHCHMWLAKDVVQTHPLDLDQGEEISVSAYTLEEVQAAIAAGRMINALALLALSRVFDLRSRAI